MPKIERLSKYKPSAIANVFDIKGRQPRATTGLEKLRPIAPSSRPWLSNLLGRIKGGKKKGRKQFGDFSDII